VRFPYLRSANKGKLAELSGKKGKIGNIQRSSQTLFLPRSNHLGITKAKEKSNSTPLPKKIAKTTKQNNTST
jgi:hypothetical protein